jgi:hypothetical protein
MNADTERSAGWLVAVGTLLAILACYGTLAVIGALSLMGIALAVDEQLWAGAIIVFTLIALIGFVAGWRRHRSTTPVVLGLFGAGLILWTMLIAYNRPLEIAGFACLVVAAWLDWRARRDRRPTSVTG